METGRQPAGKGRRRAERAERFKQKGSPGLKVHNEKRRARTGKRKLETFVPRLSDGYKERDDRSVFIGRLPSSVTSKSQVGDALAHAFGPVNHVHVQGDLKFGFVHFDTVEAAQDALRAGRTNILGAEVEIKNAGPRQFSFDHRQAEGGLLPEDEAQGSGDGVFAEEDEARPSDASAQLSHDEKASGTMVGEDFDAEEGTWEEGMWQEEPPSVEQAEEVEQDDHHGMGDEPIDGEEVRLLDEEKIQNVRVSAIFALQAAGGALMLNKLGEEVSDYSAHLPPDKTLDDILQAFSDNFEMRRAEDGETEVKLLSSDDKDTSKMDSLLGPSTSRSGPAPATDGRRKRQRGGKKTKQSQRPGGQNLRLQKPRMKLTGGRNRVSAARSETSNSVVAGPLSDGFKQRDERTVWIGQIPSKVKTKHDVALAFQRACGPVVHVHVRDDLKFGFVHFADVQSAEAALRARSVDVLGSRVEVRTAGKNGPELADSINQSRRGHREPAPFSSAPYMRRPTEPSWSRQGVRGERSGNLASLPASAPNKMPWARGTNQTGGNYYGDPRTGVRLGGYSAASYNAGGNNAGGRHANGSDVGYTPIRQPGVLGHGQRTAAALAILGPPNSSRGPSARSPAQGRPALGATRGPPVRLPPSRATPQRPPPTVQRPAIARVAPPRPSARPSKAPHLARPSLGPSRSMVTPTPKGGAMKRSARQLGPAPGKGGMKRSRPS